jgi:hypothetical protein
MSEDKEFKEYLLKTHIRLKELDSSKLAIVLDGIDELNLNQIDRS